MRRGTGETLMLLIAGTICLSVLVIEVFVITLSFIDPDRDVTGAVAFVSSTLNTLIGLLAGYIAGRTNARPAG
jgi:hypothetical protein